MGVCVIYNRLVAQQLCCTLQPLGVSISHEMELSWALLLDTILNCIRAQECYFSLGKKSVASYQIRQKSPYSQKHIYFSSCSFAISFSCLQGIFKITLRHTSLHTLKTHHTAYLQAAAALTRNIGWGKPNHRTVSRRWVCLLADTAVNQSVAAQQSSGEH